MRRCTPPSSTTATRFQSTHPRGVRHGRRLLEGATACFNPRTREGCDSWGYYYAVRIDVSIHAPARGATRPSLISVSSFCFNPRTREGCDGFCFRYRRAFVSFNPRTREGCDRLLLPLPAPLVGVSIHAPARGATIPGYFDWLHTIVSIHAPARGATLPPEFLAIFL